MEERQMRFQVIDITIPNPTTANTTVSNSIQLDRDYNRIIGIGWFEVQAGGISGNYNVAARTNRQSWIDPINSNAWAANTGVPPEQKYYEVNIPYGSGDVFYVDVTPNANTSAAMSGQLVLKLQRTLTELPK